MAIDKKFSILNKTKGKIPNLPFLHIKESALGKDFSVSLVFVGDKLSRKLNFEHRGKDKPTNVLSFPLSKNSGEIFINARQAKREIGLFKKNFKNQIGFLFIHGLLHLKGLDHGSTMDKLEEKLCERFNLGE